MGGLAGTGASLRDAIPLASFRGLALFVPRRCRWTPHACQQALRPKHRRDAGPHPGGLAHNGLRRFVRQPHLKNICYK
ncbi:MAG: hypothetical protein KME26_31910 [Oscillatoria princeps RMCB-10]|nr:hypothetical protein [Oscillatoria princeps RMCB-10]